MSPILSNFISITLDTPSSLSAVDKAHQGHMLEFVGDFFYPPGFQLIGQVIRRATA